MKQILAIAALFLGGSFLTLAQSTAWTYQGRLTEAGAPADGTYEFRFALYDALTSGSRVSAYFTNTVSVVDGLFTASMDFGSGPFTGADRWLEIGVKTNGSTSNYWVQRPRQPLAPAPLAIRSLIALSADQLGGQGPGDYVAVSGDTMTGTLVLPANGLRAGTDQLVLSGGRVGIGTSSPSYPLHLADTAQIMEKIVSSHTAGTWLDIENTSTGGNRWGFVSTGSANGEGAGHLLLRDITDGRTVMTLKDTGNVGIGTTAPEARLHIDGGSITEPNGGGYLVIGNTALNNLSFDNNEIQARYNGAPTPIEINGGGGNVYLAHGGSGGRVGIGTGNPQAALDVVTRENLSALRLYNPHGASQIALQEVSGNAAYVNFYKTGTYPVLELYNAGHYLSVNSSGAAFASGSFYCVELWETSDRNQKTNVESIDSTTVLDRVLSLPISTWAFTNAVDRRHIGPMAQDFHAAFGLGDDDKLISTRDLASVGLAAIQGLNQKLEAENAALKRQLERLEQLVEQLAK